MSGDEWSRLLRRVQVRLSRMFADGLTGPVLVEDDISIVLDEYALRE